MAQHDPMVEHCLELLAGAGASSSRPMFGGHGLRVDGVFVGLIVSDRLYLKVDPSTRPQFAAAGCEPFVYAGKGRPVVMSYWTAPPQAMESPALMVPWARLAIDAALRARAAKGSSGMPGSQGRRRSGPTRKSKVQKGGPAAKVSRGKP